MCESEFEIMKVIWAKEGISSREVSTILSNKMNWSSSTVKTLLSRLLEKKYIVNKVVGNKYMYYSNCKEEEILNEMTLNLTTKFCNKKVYKIIESIILNNELSKEDVRNIFNLLESKKDIVDEVKCNCLKGQCNC